VGLFAKTCPVVPQLEVRSLLFKPSFYATSFFPFFCPLFFTPLHVDGLGVCQKRPFWPKTLGPSICNLVTPPLLKYGGPSEKFCGLFCNPRCFSVPPHRMCCSILVPPRHDSLRGQWQVFLPQAGNALPFCPKVALRLFLNFFFFVVFCRCLPPKFSPPIFFFVYYLYDLRGFTFCP